jgi:hypothetical protein
VENYACRRKGLGLYFEKGKERKFTQMLGEGKGK